MFVKDCCSSLIAMEARVIPTRLEAARRETSHALQLEEMLQRKYAFILANTKAKE